MAKPRARPSRRRAREPRPRAVPVTAPATGRAKKISITVDETVLEDTRAWARRAGRTLSAHINEVLARDSRRKHLRKLLDEYEAEHGVITEQELAEIEDQWRG
jgi:hypothetical protein